MSFYALFSCMQPMLLAGERFRLSLIINFHQQGVPIQTMYFLLFPTVSFTALFRSLYFLSS